MEEIIFYDLCIKSAGGLLTETQLYGLYSELIKRPEKLEILLLLRNLYLFQMENTMNKELVKQLMANIKTDVINTTDLVSQANRNEAEEIRDKILSTLKSISEVIDKIES